MAATQVAPQYLLKKPANPSFALWISVLVLMVLIGLVGMLRTLLFGLQVTNLSDLVPWGLWITQDLTSIGLGAGAFTFSAIVYLFRLKRFEPLARAAVFIGFLGYTSAMLILAMDIGRPDRFWHPLVYWNVHSVLWEITLCVILYSTVLAFEFLPILFSTKYFDRWPQLRKFGEILHQGAPVMAVLGMLLSMLHQSSLGATYGVISGRAIWFKPSMPVMFIISAVAGGISLTLLATILTSKILHKQLISTKLQNEVARLAAFVLLAYLYLKLWDWAATNYYSHAPGTATALERLQATTPYTQTFWWIEVLLGGFLPAFLLLYSGTRRNDRLAIFALASIVLGVVINRWNVTLSGLVVPPEWSPGLLGNPLVTTYSPSWTEIAVTTGILGYALLAFTLGVKYLPIYPGPGKSSDH
jgi:molybdopterin-containing oxidoreductase family membrane subunit